MKRLYRRKEDGIASTVGTIFALMIFTALLSMFMTQVVPVQMKGNEAQHDMQVISQFSYIRSMMDLLALTKNTNYTAYIPIKLGAEGITLFVSPTYGQLAVFPTGNESNFLLSIHFPDVAGNEIYANSSGSIQMFIPNRYYIPEIISLENGAVSRYNFQANNTTFVIEPNIKFSLSEGRVIISAVLNVLYGTSLTVSGTETRNLGITYVGSASYVYTPKDSVNITVRSEYTYGNMHLNFTKFWLDYINNTLQSSLGSNVRVEPNGNTTLQIYNVARVNVNFIYYEVEIGA
ncbi:hypothetical protein B6U71_04325 [Euryarchaeota archaeon ex4484_178]|nr:MAG: hypothetical protein B6U71_04325 [Euryarchaeota archaeon ex4484_178]